jgi:hypothetical protein
MMRTTILFMLGLLQACGGVPAKVAPIKACGGSVPASVPIIQECAAAAVAEAKFLEYTEHRIGQYSIYPMRHTPTHWYFMFQGWVDEPKRPLPGYHWMVTVDKKTGNTELTPGA